MASTVRRLFQAAGARRHGSVKWGERIPAAGTTGVYVVALAAPTATAPISRPAVERLLAARPELAVDGRHPAVETLAERLATMWCPDEIVLYIGLAGPRSGKRGDFVSKRVAEYYRTRLGDRSPHAGGWPLKTLTVTDDLYVHYAYCDHYEDAERAMLDAFATATSSGTRATLPGGVALPFANLVGGDGRRQPHGITGAKAPRRTRTPRSGHAPQPADQSTTRVVRPVRGAQVTAEQFAARLGISGKTFRAWLRAQRLAGNPLVTGHQHRGSWLFDAEDATALEAQYRQRS
ncbi:hypothetical protein Q5424_10235 [Conexibacter sp. JD483]|uniref:hypothetical protein n=1 Tax=unclassified Conexibacter TaxID=2627773 RepID=UPI00272738AC|nr:MULTISPECIES: hypothetical protein [unclassified Conexibacter]MDO8188316.1 hypothetical protein [Conexibacter sp. CPCC 205706]MDO8200736.1 hypothetical protein [Conexibacter sp. CPCC 205762]MDR9369460.1 hypothetical protein [Conexibacter sp. JD483]